MKDDATQTDKLTDLMNRATDLTSQRGYYRDTDAALQEIFEFYIEYRPQIAELEARRDIFRDIDLPALAQAQFVLKQLPDIHKRLAQLEAQAKHPKDQATPNDQIDQTLPKDQTLPNDQVDQARPNDQIDQARPNDQIDQTLPNDQTAKQKEINALIKQFPDMSKPKQEDIVTKAQRIMGDRYQAPIDRLFE